MDPNFTPEFVTLGDIEDLGGIYGFPNLPDAPQQGTATLIEVNDRRALDAVWRDSRLYLTTTIDPNVGSDPANSGQATAHLIRIDTSAVTGSGSPAGLLALNAETDLGAEDVATGTSTFYPSVAVNGAGDIQVGFAASAGSIYAGAYATPVGPTLVPETTVTIRAGVDYYIRTFGSPRNRWGDYSGISLDPVDDRIFWVFNQFANTRGSVLAGEDGRWGTAWRACARSCFLLNCPPPTTVFRGQPLNLSFCVMNCGPFPEPAVQIQIFDTKGWCPPTFLVQPLPVGPPTCFNVNCLPPTVACNDTSIYTFMVISPSGNFQQCLVPVFVGQPATGGALPEPDGHRGLRPARRPLPGQRHGRPGRQRQLRPRRRSAQYRPGSAGALPARNPHGPAPGQGHLRGLQHVHGATHRELPDRLPDRRLPPDTAAFKGTPVSRVFCVNNCGPLPDTLTIQLTDRLGWFPPVTRTNVIINPGATLCDTLTFTIPPVCSATMDTILYHVQSNLGGADSCDARVMTGNRPPTPLCQNVAVTGSINPFNRRLRGRGDGRPGGQREF